MMREAGCVVRQNRRDIYTYRVDPFSARDRPSETRGCGVGAGVTPNAVPDVSNPGNVHSRIRALGATGHIVGQCLSA